MANKKISELTAFTLPTSDDLLVMVDGSTSKKITFGNFQAAVLGGLSPTENADGFTLAGGSSSERSLGISGGNFTLTGGGSIAGGGFTLTIPATGTAALLGVANVFSLAQSVTLSVVGSSAAQTVHTYTVNKASGTVAAGFGSALVFNGQSNDVADRAMGQIAVRWATATDATRKSRMVFSVADAVGVTEAMRLEDNGAGVGMIGFLGANAAIRQTSGANLTNNVTSGGTDDTIANYTDLTTYATDAAAIRNNIYQLARKLKQVNDALRLYGLLT